MKNRTGCCFLVVLMMCMASCAPELGSPDHVAMLETSYGRVVIELFPEDASNHVWQSVTRSNRTDDEQTGY